MGTPCHLMFSPLQTFLCLHSSTCFFQHKPWCSRNNFSNAGINNSRHPSAGSLALSQRDNACGQLLTAGGALSQLWRKEGWFAGYHGYVGRMQVVIHPCENKPSLLLAPISGWEGWGWVSQGFAGPLGSQREKR